MNWLLRLTNWISLFLKLVETRIPNEQYLFNHVLYAENVWMDNVQYSWNCVSFEVPLYLKLTYGTQTDRKQQRDTIEQRKKSASVILKGTVKAPVSTSSIQCPFETARPFVLAFCRKYISALAIYILYTLNIYFFKLKLNSHKAETVTK